MAVKSKLYCDSPGCGKNIEGTDVTGEWQVVAVTSSIGSKALPSKLATEPLYHLCPDHHLGPREGRKDATAKN